MKRIILIALAALMAVSASATEFQTAAPAAQSQKKVKKVKEVKEVVFNVHLHCMNCVKKVQENISFEKGVKGLDVCLDHHTVTVKYDPAKTSEETLKDAIEKLGYKVEGVAAPGDGHHHHN
jgi:copper chaperone CopZ